MSEGASFDTMLRRELDRRLEEIAVTKRTHAAVDAENATNATNATAATDATATVGAANAADEPPTKRLCTCHGRKKTDAVTSSLASVLETVESLETAGHLNVEAQRQIAAKLKDVHGAVARKRADMATKIALQLATHCSFILSPMVVADVDGVDMFSDAFVNRLLKMRLKYDLENGLTKMDCAWLSDLFDFYIRKPDEGDEDCDMQRGMLLTLLSNAPMGVELWPELAAYFIKEDYTADMLKAPLTGDEHADEAEEEEYDDWASTVVAWEPSAADWLAPESDTSGRAKDLRAQAIRARECS